MRFAVWCLMDAMASSFNRLRALLDGLNLPDTSEGTSYGTPAFKVKERTFARLKDSETLVAMIDSVRKEILMELAPEIYFQTEHYRGWSAILVRLPSIGDDELGRILQEAWRYKAPSSTLKLLTH